MWEDLPELTDADLKELGIPMGPRKRLLKAIATLGEDSPGEPADDTDGPGQTTRPQEAERRQLTVMFCDLVGSTELSQKMDPEDYREIIRAYQATCKSAIERYEGYVARYMGDGVLVYFGYPKAHEDDPVRALHAGLNVIDSVRQLAAELQQVSEGDLAVRVGAISFCRRRRRRFTRVLRKLTHWLALKSGIKR